MFDRIGVRQVVDQPKILGADIQIARDVAHRIEDVLIGQLDFVGLANARGGAAAG